MEFTTPTLNGIIFFLITLIHSPEHLAGFPKEDITASSPEVMLWYLLFKYYLTMVVCKSGQWYNEFLQGGNAEFSLVMILSILMMVCELV